MCYCGYELNSEMFACTVTGFASENTLCSLLQVIKLTGH